MTKQEILDRMEKGEPLRWVSGDVVGDGRDKHLRYLFLGREELDNNGHYLVVVLEREKKIIQTTRDKYNKKKILDYRLA